MPTTSEKLLVLVIMDATREAELGTPKAKALETDET